MLLVAVDTGLGLENLRWKEFEKNSVDGPDPGGRERASVFHLEASSTAVDSCISVVGDGL